MYSTCIHCRQPLGRNDVIEALPIGRRLAFDASKGRLWVVCRACERWNLTPFEERWEAIEQSERAFRDTRVRASTDNIGLARLADGTELVRVGAPMRPEFAAWRFGDQFGRRRRRNLLRNSGIVVGLGTGAGLLISGAVATGLGIVAVVPIMHLAMLSTALAGYSPRGEPVQLPNGERVKIVGTPRLITMQVPEGWGIDIGCVATYTTPPRDPKRPPVWFEEYQYEAPVVTRRQVRGADAVALLRHALLSINRAASPPKVIADGVRLIEDAGGPDRFAPWAVSKRREWGAQQTSGDTGDIAHIPVAARLAFEMALHEESERRALEGELAELARAWQDAETIAKISDTLLVPPSVDAKFNALRSEHRDP